MPFEDANRRAARLARTERVAEAIVAVLVVSAAAICTTWLF